MAATSTTIITTAQIVPLLESLDEDVVVVVDAVVDVVVDFDELAVVVVVAVVVDVVVATVVDVVGALVLDEVALASVVVVSDCAGNRTAAPDDQSTTAAWVGTGLPPP